MVQRLNPSVVTSITVERDGGHCEL